MSNYEIYENALRILGIPVNSEGSEDYEERAPYLIAAFCTSVLEIDEFLRMAAGLGSTPHFNRVWLSLDEDFPLLDRLAPIASLDLASSLVTDENAELSDRLYERTQDALSDVRCGVISSIEDVYI